MHLPDSTALLGVNMMFVAVVLYIIALNLQEKVGGKETAAMCILTGGFNVLSALYSGFIMGDPASMAGTLLFGFTYLFFAMNILTQSETYTGMGNYCLFVVLACIPFIVVNISAPIFAFLWIMWAQLWGAFWLANGLHKPIQTFLATDTYITAAINFVIGIAFLFQVL